MSESDSAFATKLKTPDELIREIRDIVSTRAGLITARVKGKLFGIERTLSAVPKEHSPEFWVLRAHLGTLEKLMGLFVRNGNYESFELLAIARNLFENLVWVRLFNRELQYGLVFYEQLLVQQKQNTESMIAKVEAESVAFKHFASLDSSNLDIAFADVFKGEPTAAQIKKAQKLEAELAEELDRKVRRTFSLYAAAAKFNSYGYQRHLLLNEVLPKHRSLLQIIENHLTAYRLIKSSLLSPKMQARSATRWNWKDRAVEVSMEVQYDFLYSYTSKLLHSTPMNLITEKALSASEVLMMLDYAFVTISDIFDEIEAFNFPGQHSFLVIELESDN